MTNYEKIKELIDITKEDLADGYGILQDGRIVCCLNDSGCCKKCCLQDHEDCYVGMIEWLNEEIKDEPERVWSNGEKVVLDTVKAAVEVGAGNDKINTSLMSIIAAALVDIKDALTKKGQQ